MKFNQLRDFVAVAENGSLRGAARALGLSQPAITKSVRELEHSLGAQLFIREARGVTLTPVGETFLQRASHILGEIRRTRETVSQQQGGVEGALVVGMSMSAHLGILGGVVGPFRERYPNVRLRLIEGLLTTLESDLRTGAMDLYVGPVPQEEVAPDLHAARLLENERVVIARRGHPLAEATALSDLKDVEWLTTSLTQDADEEVSAVFETHGLSRPNLVCQCQSALSILTLLVNSDMMAIVPVQWADSPMLDRWLQPVPLQETFAAPPIMLVHRAGLGLTPAAEHFVHLVRRACRLPAVLGDN
mgnify:CR=1 FL=1